MTRTVPCPECHRPAQILDRFTLQRPTGPVEYLRVQCDGPLSFLINAEEIDSGAHPGEPGAHPGELCGGLHAQGVDRLTGSRRP